MGCACCAKHTFSFIKHSVQELSRQSATCEQVEVVPCYTESHSTAADGAAAANVAQLATRVCIIVTHASTDLFLPCNRSNRLSLFRCGQYSHS